MEIFLVWLIFSIVVGVAGAARGRSGFGWFAISCLISPVLGLILVLVLPNKKAESEMAELRKQLVVQHEPEPASPSGDTRMCPFCAETVKAKAVICRYCQRELPPLVRCPSCGNTIAQDASECWSCKAVFGVGSDSQIVKLSSEVEFPDDVKRRLRNRL